VKFRDLVLFVVPLAFTSVSSPVAQDIASLSAGNQRAVDFDSAEAVLDLKPYLTRRNVSDPGDPGSGWFTVSVENAGAKPVVRVLLAAEPPDVGISVAPPLRRPLLRQVAASDSGVVIERADAYGRRAYRVMLPPAHAATLALRIEEADAGPSLLAWNETALVAHSRRAAILDGVVVGLLAAAALLALGGAALGAKPLARWAALLLAAVFIANLTAIGALDGGWFTDPGGPYGLFALALGIAIIAAARMIDLIAPFDRVRMGASLWRRRASLVVLILGLAAAFGVPVAGLVIRLLAVLGAAAAAGYLADRGREGITAAQRLAPAAAIFALVAAAGAFETLGLLGDNLVVPAALGGFSAAGALLVAFASSVGAIEPAIRKLAPALPSPTKTGQPKVAPPAKPAETGFNVIAASHQGVFDLDLEKNVLKLSEEAAGTVGLPRQPVKIRHEKWVQRIVPEDRGVYEQAIETCRHDPGTAFRLEFRARHEGGGERWLELRVTMIGEGKEAQRCLGLIADVSDRKAVEFDLARRALGDPMTGLGNRLALTDRLQQLTSSYETAVLIVLDLDRFKSVHTSLGHDGADAILCAVAERLKEGFADTAELFRVGGDTFAVFVEQSVGAPAALGEAVRANIQEPFEYEGREIFMPVSVGVASGADAAEPLGLLKQAEMAMIQAKKAGGGRVCVFERTLATATAGDDPVALEADLRRAIERGEIEVHYQPIMRMRDGGVAGFEALLRWRHPTRGQIPPDVFIAHAEATGLIVPLGRLALGKASQDLGRWQRFFPLNPPLFVSVNVTWKQIADAGFVQDVQSALKAAGLPKGTLKLEVTESDVMKDVDAAETALKQLREHGAGLAIDDFGTGHSSLGQLRRFPFELIKIDKSFLDKREEGENGSQGTILASIVSLAHELGLQVVTEGVEDEEDAKRLRTLGCEFAQGFLFGAPLPPGEVVGFIALTYER